MEKRIHVEDQSVKDVGVKGMVVLKLVAFRNNESFQCS